MTSLRLAPLIALLLAAALAPAVACPVAGETPMLIVTLYFGETIPGRAPLTPREWAAFTAQTITPAFPNGFTVTDGSGQWRDPKTGATEDDPTKLLTVALPTTATLAETLRHVMKAYEKRFNQQAVGLTTAAACGGFDQ